MPPIPANQPPLSSIKDLFTHFGGGPGMAKLMGMSIATVGAWRTRDRIPVEHWPALMKKCKKKGVVLTADDLLALNTRRKTGRAA